MFDEKEATNNMLSQNIDKRNLGSIFFLQLQVLFGFDP